MNCLPPLGSLLPGRTTPYGAHVRDGGVNFAVFSDHATAIELCLFDATGTREQSRLCLAGPDGGIFHGFVPGAQVGQVYGLRAHGPYAPQAGHRFNPHKLLLDPCAREIVGQFNWRPEHHGYVLGDSADSFDSRDNAAWALKARVAPPAALPPDTEAPRVPPAQRVLYELHVKGFSRLHPAIPPSLRGTFAALAHPAAIAHFKSLGVTTLSLLPVHYHLDEPMLPPGLVNYWGYNTLGFFCPDPRLGTTPGDPTAVNAEFRRMVATLHAHGLEVVLDVVFNHTPEGNHEGPSLSFRGLDQKSWYRTDEAGLLANWSACGNTINVAHPQVSRFVIDSLRYWVQVMGVDGFRFDLAPVLGRGADGAFDRNGAFFTALAQDPVLARTVLIAEPWDAGPDGYCVGKFPDRWQEWNDRFRDAARGFWLARGGGLQNTTLTRADFAEAFAGSPATYPPGRRPATASVNFIAVHDGFTLADMVSYSTKHNHANGEDNRDGRDDELCAHFGVEGPSADAEVTQTRRQVRRALLATLLLARGTPMLCAGDEFGNSQQGNNNAWNQDNPTGWLGWEGADAEQVALVGALLRLRAAEPLLRPQSAGDAPLRWQGLDDPDQALACVVGEDSAQPLLVAFNPEPHALPMPLPAGHWCRVLDTAADPPPQAPAMQFTIELGARSVCVLRRDAAFNRARQAWT